jgi:hypothetical protein
MHRIRRRHRRITRPDTEACNVGTKRLNWGEISVILSSRACLRYALIDDAREQTSLCEPEADTDANELFMPGNGRTRFPQRWGALTDTYVLTNPMDNLVKKTVSFGGSGRKITYITTPHRT